MESVREYKAQIVNAEDTAQYALTRNKLTRDVYLKNVRKIVSEIEDNPGDLSYVMQALIEAASWVQYYDGEVKTQEGIIKILSSIITNAQTEPDYSGEY